MTERRSSESKYASVSDIQLMRLFKDVVSDVLWCFESLQSLKVASNSQKLKAVILSPSRRGSNYHVKILRKLLFSSQVLVFLLFLWKYASKYFSYLATHQRRRDI